MTHSTVSSSASPFRSFWARTLRTLPRVLLASALLSAGCQPAKAPESNPPPAATGPLPAPVQSDEAPSEAVEYVTLPPAEREAPPPASPSPPWSFPKIDDHTLPNGLAVKLVPRTTLPLVEITLVVRSGQDSDGKRPGLALLAGEMLKVGGTDKWASRELLDRVESLGSSLSVITSRDATTVTMAVTSDRFDEAMDLIGLVVTKPRFLDAEFRKLKQREIDRVRSHARTNAAWAASMVLFRELYRQEDGAAHPYSYYDATPDQLESLKLWEIKQWHSKYFSPRNAALVVGGDVTAEQVQSAAGRALGKWRGAKVTPPKVDAPKLEPKRAIFLVDRPKSSQAEVRLATFGVEHSSPEYPLLKVANQVLGGGVAGRLFLDVREERSLAYSTYSQVERVRQGPQPVILSAGTQTAKVGLTLQALLEHATKMAEAGPTVAESQAASSYLSDLFLLRMESVGSLTSMVSALAIYSLSNDYYDEYRQAVSTADPAAVTQTAGTVFGSPGSIVVVAGDAERLATPLSHFGDVTIIDPGKGFSTVKTVPQDPNAKIELDRLEGT